MKFEPTYENGDDTNNEVKKRKYSYNIKVKLKNSNNTL